MKRTVLGLAPLTLALCLSTTAACGDDANPGMEAGETGDGDGDGDATDTDDSDSDSDSASGDGDGDDPATDTDETETETTDDPGPDSDMDGTPDASDNCPDVPNPNQLDYDGNGMGNVCDVQVFTSVMGMFNTTATADTQLGGCTIPLEIMVQGGEVLVQLDDDAAVAAFQINSLNIADLPTQVCSIGGLIEAEVTLTNFVIANNGGDFPVNMPHTLEQHDNGQIAGDSNGNYPVLATSDLTADVAGMATESTLELDGELPVFTANITMAGGMGVMSWLDPQHVVATTTLEEGLPVPLDFALTGMVGNVTLMP